MFHVERFVNSYKLIMICFHDAGFYFGQDQGDWLVVGLDCDLERFAVGECVRGYGKGYDDGSGGAGLRD